MVVELHFPHQTHLKCFCWSCRSSAHPSESRWSAQVTHRWSEQSDDQESDTDPIQQPTNTGGQQCPAAQWQPGHAQPLPGIAFNN